MSPHPQDLSLREQARLIASGELDPAALLEQTLARIEERNEPLRAVVATFPEESERMLREAPRGPLYGVPVAIKDMFSLPWRAPRDGSHHEQLAAAPSGAFRRLRDAGAVVVGVTNMHMWGAGSTGHISAYGPAANPWQVERCAGGSSGGSAAAVAARIVAGAVGTDGGGSIRLPAAYCGVTGLKGTYGSIPRDGFTHGFSSMSEAGPMCRDAGDARLLGQVIFDRELEPVAADALRVAVVRSPFCDDLDPQVERLCQDALETSGWNLSEHELRGSEHAQAAGLLRLTLEALPNLRREELADSDPLVRALVKYELLMPSRLLVRADRVRSLLRRSLADAFERVELVAWPTVAAPAPPIAGPVVELPSGRVPADPVNLRQTGIGNLAGIPGISVPVGFNEDGLPVALQLQTAWGDDALLLAAAEHIESATERRFVDVSPPLAQSPSASL